MPIVRNALLATGALALGGLIAAQTGVFSGTPPTQLGVRDGRLAAPSTTPNSVSSQARLHADHSLREQAHIEPLALRGDRDATLARIAAVASEIDGGRLVERRPDYLRFEFTTRWMHFVDDAEFWFDPTANVVQVRSASRLGRKDFDVNRQRIEAIRGRLNAAP
ncbi:MAG: DUF1499 domain-containing protein [Burkholderiaceae bacterium]